MTFRNQVDFIDLSHMSMHDDAMDFNFLCNNEKWATQIVNKTRVWLKNDG